MIIDAVPKAERSRARGPYAKSGATRESILDSALQVFAQSGYRAGSLREIAAGVGMSEAGLLHHFRSKSALLEAVLDRRDDLSKAELPPDRDDGIAVLRTLVDLAETNARIPGVVELYCTLSAEATSEDHPAHGYFVRRYEWTRSLVRQAFESVRRAGGLADGVDPSEAAIMTVAMMDGLQVQWLLNRDVVDMHDTLARFFRTVVPDFTVERERTAEPVPTPRPEARRAPLAEAQPVAAGA